MFELYEDQLCIQRLQMFEEEKTGLGIIQLEAGHVLLHSCFHPVLPSDDFPGQCPELVFQNTNLQNSPQSIQK